MVDVARLDSLPPAEFEAAVAPWFEGAPRFLARLAAARPFGDEPTLFGRAAAIALAMPEAEQIELIDAHPRLGAPPATVSAASHREQGYDRDTTEAIAEARPPERRVRGAVRVPVLRLRQRPLAPGAGSRAGGGALRRSRFARSGARVADVVAIARDRAARADTEVGVR